MKPRVTYQQFVQMKHLPKDEEHQPGSVGALIERFIAETGQPGMKPLGPTHLISLKALQRRPIARKSAEKLTKRDIIEHCRERRKEVVPATCNQDIVFLSGVLKYAGSAWEDCEDVSSASIEAARPFLLKHQLIGKSAPRTRRPTDEELQQLLDLFTKQNAHHRTEINMVEVVAFALASTRRISEICRITWGDVDFEKGVYTVRDLKHPTKKKGNDKAFPLFPELAEIILRQPRLTSSPTERVFPYNSRSCSQRYTDAKRRLGIQDLRFHDNRREAITRWLKKLPPHKVRQISGHENTIILERVYAAPKAEDLLHEVAAMTPKVEVPWTATGTTN